MNKLFVIFALLAFMPADARTESYTDDSGAFVLAKAVKLGRGNAYSVAADTKINNGGTFDTDKSCDTHCAGCDKSTGKCNSCAEGYYLKNSKCVICPANASCANGDTFICEDYYYKSGDSCLPVCSGVICKTGYKTAAAADSCCCTADTPVCSIANCAQCDSSGLSCTKCNDGYTTADNAKSCISSSVTVNRYHRYNGSKIPYTSTIIPRSGISSYYDSWPDVDIYDEDGGKVTETTESIAMVCANGTGEFWSKSDCDKYKNGSGYYCAESGWSCQFETRLCAIDNCMNCDPEGLCATCEAGYKVGTGGSDYGKCVKAVQIDTPVSGACPNNLQDCGSTGCCPTGNSCSYYKQQAASGGFMCLQTASDKVLAE